MRSATTGATWPEIVWETASLRGLDARGRSEIEAAGNVRALRAGDVLFRPGDPADALYVVASGAFTLRGVCRGDAEPAVVRRAAKGDVLGEEATVFAFATRQLEARCEVDAVVAAVPLVVLKRAVGRAGGADLLAKVERALRRSATLDLLRTTTFTRALPEGDVEVLLDAARHLHVARGEHVYREGEAAGDAYLVADGLLQAQSSDDGKPRIEAYLGRGDLFGDEELAERRARAIGVVASGPSWLVAIPRDVFVVIARRNMDLAAAARRLRTENAAEQPLRPGAQTTAHVFSDLYRMRVARSLLVIDQDSCIRCGHCAWSCADAHADGVSRLVRRGDKIVVDAGGDGRGKTAPLLVPNSCQHCKNPSCMIDCPTGAIGRDARGEVFIREDLCTGCGSCAKACPWENIQIAPRTDTTKYSAVAVKCDLCSGQHGGPACVASCPTEAIARIDPNTALVELRRPNRSVAGEPARPIMPVPTRAWPWVLGSAVAGAGLAALPAGKWTSGIAAGVLVALLVGYSVAKRVLLGGGRRGGFVAKLRARFPLARFLYIAHLALGGVTSGVVLEHVAGQVPANAGGALTIALGIAIVTGAFGASMSVVLPRALSRVERKSVLPEELAARPKEIDEQIFTALSGKSELVKALFVTALRPYRRSAIGPLLLVLSRRSLRDEEKALRSRLDRLTGGKTGASLAGIDEVVRLVVEHRAVRLQRVLSWVLRGWLVPHVAATAAALILLIVHVVAVSRPLAAGAQRPARSSASEHVR
ncbi:MAG TPA: cyclic nucleotide-binding domain-containing protein [Labilithrix sp.]|nr:cyclic nucleotide-binding domain-containing protein [Labilithrix sp.]